VIDFLEPFKKASEELQGEDYLTLHLVMLWFYNLLQSGRTLPTSLWRPGVHGFALGKTYSLVLEEQNYSPI